MQILERHQPENEFEPSKGSRSSGITRSVHSKFNCISDNFENILHCIYANPLIFKALSLVSTYYLSEVDNHIPLICYNAIRGPNDDDDDTPHH